jgi:F-type H+-transporting ATPase subunit alpha
MKQVAGRIKLDLAQFRELAAFAQFGSDLDAATQAKIDRGKRIVEIFKQPQYRPVPVEIQTAILWTVQNGLFDDVPVEKVKDCQDKMTEYLVTRKPGLLNKIKTEKVFDEATANELKTAIKEFKNFYK